MKVDLNRTDVIAPNFKRRLSGVTSTVVRLVPLQAEKMAITTCAPDMPEDVPNVSWREVIAMSRKGPSGPRVWHARRNIEMLAGIALRRVGKDLRLVFTSASQRQHTWLTKSLISRMDAVIATSAKTATYLERPSTVIHHGIDTDVFAPAESKRAARAALGLPLSGPLVGCIGRIRPQKGTDVFVDAMLSVMETHPTAHALVMGRALAKDQDYLDELKVKAAAAGKTDRFHFLDEVPVWETPQYYQAMDLYVAPQRWEGFGLTPLEAMACGAPVVATRVGAFEELVTENATGHLVAPGNVPEMAQAIEDLLEMPDRLTQMSNAARDDMIARFRLAREADAIIEIYRSLLRA